MKRKRKPNELKRNIPKNQRMCEKVFLSVLGKTAPDYKVVEFLMEWKYGK